ncbi:MAG: alpha/beta hydrolase [Marinobacterium sp.]|nr:alpha/beta hydrolase [Marinobacterium sp.]
MDNAQGPGMAGSETFRQHRQWFRERLGVELWLPRRQIIQLSDGIHTELYHYHEDAPTLIFLPGIGTYVELYAELLARLSDSGFNVLGIDPPGHGYSQGRRGVYTVEQMDEIISQAIDQLSLRYRGGFGVFGFSIGSLLAVSAAELDSRIDSVLCGTLLLPDLPPDLLHWAGWQWTWSSAFFFPQLELPLGALVDFRQLMAGHPAAEAINNDPLIIYDYPITTLSSLFNHRSAVVRKQFDFQALIIHGDRDEVLPLAYSERVVRHCCHPFELQPVSRAGHMMPWMQTPQLLELAANWFHRTLG